MARAVGELQRTAEQGAGPAFVGPSAVAAVHQLQRRAGNHAASQLLSRTPWGPVVVQRQIAITPDDYARKHSTTADQLSDPQLTDYYGLAVQDEYDYVLRFLASTPVEGSDRTTAELERFHDTFVDTTQPKSRRVAALRTLVVIVNRCQRDREDHYENEYTEEGMGASIAPPGRKTRYSVAPLSGYAHAGGHATWRDYEDMKAKLAPQLGQIVPTLPQVNAREADTKVRQMQWATARQFFPKPLVNLLFDVRYQLDSAGRVVDERTPYQMKKREVTPKPPGTLRSWHQDTLGVLPLITMPAALTGSAQKLHAHYVATSGPGSGSSISNAATAPAGYAEYTGTGSAQNDQEHNIKVVVDYVAKRVFVTLTHYQYWALVNEGDAGWKLWNLGTQKVVDAKRKYEDDLRIKHLHQQDGIFMNPWMEIVF